MMKKIIIVVLVLFVINETFAEKKVIKENESNMTEFNQDGFDFVKVDGGTFTMGCTPEQTDFCSIYEKPSHSVILSSFSIGKYEVTQSQWTSIMGSNPSQFSNCSDCPVEMVSWDDIQIFISSLKTKTGKNYRLPTEAEWEYAARGGNKSKGYRYSGSHNYSKVAWCENDGSTETHSVGTKKANELGIYDMSGNVYEWVNDWLGDYTDASETNPNGHSSGTYRIIRGGSWKEDARFVRVPYRLNELPGNKNNDLGFRLVLP